MSADLPAAPAAPVHSAPCGACGTALRCTCDIAELDDVGDGFCLTCRRWAA